MELSTAKGTRDFPPEEKILRDTVLDTLKGVAENYGFNPIETPTIENYDTLSAKFAAGQESDALQETFTLKDRGKRKLELRFDLTVPFSRFIAMNPTMKMPFKKYMTGEVFRDGPIKTGRYRQFTQFDIDIVGASSMKADAEILSAVDAAFRAFDIPFYIEVNNRKILDGVLLDAGVPEKKWETVTISIDKLKKIGKKGVTEELVKKGLKKDTASKVLDVLSKEKTNAKTLSKLNIQSDIGKEGLKEMKQLLELLKDMGSVNFDPSLARGLAYYTGPIYEVFLKDSSITSSAAGGGRYDELIGNYLGRDQIPATGVSFGIEVLIEAMKEKGRASKKSVVQAYVIPIKAFDEAMQITAQLREAGINTDIDLLERGISSNLQFADSYGIPYVLFIGKRELKAGKVKLRNMKSGKEELLTVKKVIGKLR